jgi:hypothetical protein
VCAASAQLQICMSHLFRVYRTRTAQSPLARVCAAPVFAITFRRMKAAPDSLQKSESAFEQWPGSSTEWACIFRRRNG